MRLLRSYPAMSFALVLLSIVAVCLAQGSAAMLIVAGALAALSWYVTEGPRSKHLPRWVSNILVIAVSLHVVVDLVQHQHDVRGVLGRFMVLLTLIKLYERQTPRDHAQLLMLSLLLMITGCLQSDDLLFGILLVLYAVLGLYVLLLHQLYASYDDNRRARLDSMPSEYRFTPSLRPVTGRRVGVQFRGFTVLVGLVGLGMSAVLFLAFPRGVGEDIVPRLEGPSRDRRTQFTDEINLMSGTRITESRSVALVVTLYDEQGRPIEYGRPLLLRGSVLERYEGDGRWRPSRGQPQRMAVAAGQQTPLGESVMAGGGLRVEVQPYIRSDVLFAPQVPLAVQRGAAGDIRFFPDTLLIKTVQSGARDAYEIMFEPAADEPMLKKLGVPRDQPGGGWRMRSAIKPTIANEAVRLLERAGVPINQPADPEQAWAWNRQVANVFMNHLHSSGLQYTLDLSDVALSGNPASDDPVAQFLTETRKGHCEFFASAMALMCQAVDIKARVITGFVAYEFDDSSMSYNVLESNAHAWVEVPTGPRRYSTFDPTPPATLRRLHATQTSLTDRLRWAYERFDGTWSSRVIEFDRQRQSQMAVSLDEGWSQRLSNGLDSLRAWAADVNRRFRMGSAGYIWLGIVALAVLIAVVAAFKIVRRWLLIRRQARLQYVHGAEHQRLVRQLGFYVDMLQVLERAKLRKPVWQPPMHFADSIEVQRPGVGAVVRELTALFYEARYGGRRLKREDLNAARQRVQQLAGELGVKVSL